MADATKMGVANARVANATQPVEDIIKRYDDNDEEDDDDGDNLEAVAHVMGVSERSGHGHNGDHLELNSEADDDDDEDEGSM